jgi:hypothetical protein
MKVRLPLPAVVFALSALSAAAQTSIDVLEQDLQEAKQKHDDATSQAMTTFLSTLQAASQSPSTALQLYKDAGGNLPDATPVHTHYEYETPSEKAIREAQDAQLFGSAAIVIQTHCALMRFAALMTINPKTPGLNDEWLAWLKTTGEMYPKLAGKRALKDVAMRDSVISNYLGFHDWGDKPPGGWSLSQLPQLYHDLILEPSRHPPTAATLDLWDIYIAMCHADETDHDKWTQEGEPPLDFDRGADDFAIEPSMEKLTTLDGIIKDNPASTHLDNWIARMQEMIRVYQGGGKPTITTAGQLPGATPGTPSSEAAGTMPVATPGTASSSAEGPVPADTPGPVSSVTVGTPPAETPSTPSSSTGGTLPAATPGTSSSAAAGTVPAATPGTSSSAAGGIIPAATPGASSAAAGGPIPAAAPGTPSSNAPGSLPAATPGTPSSGAPAPIPAPSSGAQ